MSPWLNIETTKGRALRSHGREIRPIAWSMQVNMLNPAIPVGLHFQWIRPRAVEVTGPGGTSRIPIPDYSLYVVWGVALVGILSVAIVAVTGKRARVRGGREE